MDKKALEELFIKHFGEVEECAKRAK